MRCIKIVPLQHKLHYPWLGVHHKLHYTWLRVHHKLHHSCLRYIINCTPSRYCVSKNATYLKKKVFCYFWWNTVNSKWLKIIQRYYWLLILAFFMHQKLHYSWFWQHHKLHPSWLEVHHKLHYSWFVSITNCTSSCCKLYLDAGQCATRIGLHQKLLYS